MGQGAASINDMMIFPLLCWANELFEKFTFKHMAVGPVNMVCGNYICDKFKVPHIMSFDADIGKCLKLV